MVHKLLDSSANELGQAIAERNLYLIWSKSIKIATPRTQERGDKYYIINKCIQFFNNHKCEAAGRDGGSLDGFPQYLVSSVGIRYAVLERFLPPVELAL